MAHKNKVNELVLDNTKAVTTSLSGAWYAHRPRLRHTYLALRNQGHADTRPRLIACYKRYFSALQFKVTWGFTNGMTFQGAS